MRTLYDAFSAGQPLPLADLPIQYAIFARLAARVAARERACDQLATGSSSSRELLRSWKLQPIVRVPSLNLSRLDPIVRPVQNPSACTARPEQSGGKHPLHNLTAAFSTRYSNRYTGQEDILIGTATGGAQASRGQKLMGVFNGHLSHTVPTVR